MDRIGLGLVKAPQETTTGVQPKKAWAKEGIFVLAAYCSCFSLFFVSGFLSSTVRKLLLATGSRWRRGGYTMFRCVAFSLSLAVLFFGSVAKCVIPQKVVCRAGAPPAGLRERRQAERSPYRSWGRVGAGVALCRDEPPAGTTRERHLTSIFPTTQKTN